MSTSVTDDGPTVHRLPNELLLRIFHSFVSRHSLDSVTLSHVCRRWRNVSVGVEALWSSIGVRANDDPHSAGVMQMTELYLARSGSYPLDIFVDVVAPALFLACAAHCSRWFLLHLRVNHRFLRPSAGSQPLLSHVQNQLPLLDELILKCDDCQGRSLAHCAFFEGTPQSNILNIDGHHLREACFPWANLTRVTFDALEPWHVVLVLGSGYRLQNARFTRVRQGLPLKEGSSKLKNETISRPELESLSLTVGFHENDDVNLIFFMPRPFCFLSLTTFKLSTELGVLSVDLSQFLSTRSENLRLLKLPGLHEFTGGRFLDLLQTCPLLEVLDLREKPNNAATISILTPRVLQKLSFESTYTILPCLKEFHLTIPPHELLRPEHVQTINEELVQMIRSRRVGLALTRLEVVNLGPFVKSTVGPGFAELKSKLLVLESEGLTVLFEEYDDV